MSVTGAHAMLKQAMPEWRNGRRGGLKIRWPQGCVGSTPSSGTNFPEGFSMRRTVRALGMALLLAAEVCAQAPKAPAHKTGEIMKIHHDAAVVYAPLPFVLVILARGIAGSKQSAALMADIARDLYVATQ